MQITCVLFDYDGVLTTDRTGSVTTCRYLSERTGIPIERVTAAFAKHNRALTSGRTSHEAVWPDICALLGQHIPLQLLIEAFDSTPVNEGMFTLARQLRAACRVGLLTDNKLDRIRRLRTVQRLDELFDPILVSAECGLSKSSPAFFEHALTVLASNARETVFIDNDRDNIAVAVGCGIRAIHFDDARNDVAELAATLRSRFGLPR